MLTVDCPWCETPVAVEVSETFRCDGCRVEVEVDPAPVAEMALAA